MGIPQQIHDVWSIDSGAGAIEWEGRWIPWGAVRQRAEAVATALDRAGVQPAAPVGVLLGNHPDAVAGLLGVLLRGCCVVALSPHQGAGRLAEDLRAPVPAAVIARPEEWQQRGFEPACREIGTEGLRLEEDGSVTTVTPGDPDRRHEPRPGVAVLMLTSGTTGPPKRIPLGLDALEQSLLGARHYERRPARRPSLRRGVAVLCAPLVHVSGLFRVLQCVCDGRPFVLLERFRVEPWREAVLRHRPRTVSLVPAALRMVLEAQLPPADLECLASVICGTAPLDPETARRFEERYGVPVLTTYGATEFAGGVAGWNLADHRAWGDKKRGSVGRAHPGCELRVVDSASGRPLAAGERGLLEVRSSQLGPEAEWVRTTDLASLDADGFLWIHGRADAAILRGGFKVHPAEVEGVLRRHPGVGEAVVVGLDDPRLGQVPAAAVELAPGASADREELLAFAREHLAAYQVPVELRMVTALPRTASMKVSLPEVRALFAGPG